MDGYLTYKVDINSAEFLDFLELTPSDVDSYLSLKSQYDDQIISIQDSISYEISFIDFAVDAYYNYGYEGYLTPTASSNNNLFETSASVAGINFTSSMSGNNLLAPSGGASYPMGIEEANFSINESPFYGWDCITLEIKNKWSVHLIIPN